jgi:hypothetical protein
MAKKREVKIHYSEREEEPRFAAVVEAFAGKARVSREQRKGFGSGALKVKGEIFAMMSSKGKFVVKLPKARVDELVSGDKGQRFDPGGGRVMKEWFEVEDAKMDWVGLAEEACAFVGKAKK